MMTILTITTTYTKFYLTRARTWLKICLSTNGWPLLKVMTLLPTYLRLQKDIFWPKRAETNRKSMIIGT